MESQLQPVATIQEEFNFTEAEVGRLKTFNTLPGIYTMAQSVHISRVEVASVYQAVLAAGSTHEGFVQATMWRFNPKFNFAGACALLITTEQPTPSRTECRVLVVVSLSSWSAKDGLATWYMREIPFWTISGGANRLRSCGRTSSEYGTREPPELPKFARDGGLFKSRE